MSSHGRTWRPPARCCRRPPSIRLGNHQMSNILWIQRLFQPRPKIRDKHHMTWFKYILSFSISYQGMLSYLQDKCSVAQVNGLVRWCSDKVVGPVPVQFPFAFVDPCFSIKTVHRIRSSWSRFQPHVKPPAMQSCHFCLVEWPDFHFPGRGDRRGVVGAGLPNWATGAPTSNISWSRKKWDGTF